jgi:hypothetical protein
MSEEIDANVTDDLFMYEYSPAKSLGDIFQDMIIQPPHISKRIREAFIEILQEDNMTYEDMSQRLSKDVFLRKVYEGIDTVNK